MCRVDAKRRLPIVKDAPEHRRRSDPDPEAPADRPPWHWIGFGTVAVFGVWLPLSFGAQAVRARIIAERLGALETEAQSNAAVGALSHDAQVRLTVLLLLPHLLALVLAALAGGFLVGRWGEGGVGVREAALGGFTAALIASILAWTGVSWLPLVPIALATAAAAIGGHIGKRRRSVLSRTGARAQGTDGSGLGGGGEP
jgi:hypothetical protein